MKEPSVTARNEIDYYSALMEAGLARPLPSEDLDALMAACWGAPHPGSAMRQWAEQHDINVKCPTCGGATTIWREVEDGGLDDTEKVQCPLCQPKDNFGYLSVTTLPQTPSGRQ